MQVVCHRVEYKPRAHVAEVVVLEESWIAARFAVSRCVTVGTLNAVSSLRFTNHNVIIYI